MCPLAFRLPRGANGNQGAEWNVRVVGGQFGATLQNNASSPLPATSLRFHYQAHSLHQLLDTPRGELDGHWPAAKAKPATASLSPQFGKAELAFQEASCEELEIARIVRRLAAGCPFPFYFCRISRLSQTRRLAGIIRLTLIWHRAFGKSNMGNERIRAERTPILEAKLFCYIVC
jgi:hypothetical protein